MDSTRFVPTPRDVARGGPLAHSPRLVPADAEADAVYDRGSWERAVLDSDLHRNSRYVALVLAHHADPHGELPAGGAQDATVLVALTGLSGKNVRASLSHLMHRGYIRRPSIHSWSAEQGVRPVTLTMPPARPARPSPGGEAG